MTYMRDMSAKSDTLRIARASASLRAAPGTVSMVREGRAPKGDPLMVARVAGIQAAKNTPLIIPYCHTVPLDLVEIDFELREAEIIVTAETRAIYRTGVEMEALTAASAAVLTIYDMLKPVDDAMEIGPIRLIDKKGGKSDFVPRSGFRATVIVVSDSTAANVRADRSGAAMREGLLQHGALVGDVVVVPDNIEALRTAVLDACADGVSFVITTGGTGVGPKDWTPEAVEPLFERRLDGVEDQLRAYSRKRTPFAMMGRIRAGKRGRTIIVSVPGSPGAARDAVHALFPFLSHAVEVMEGYDHG